MKAIIICAVITTIGAFSMATATVAKEKTTNAVSARHLAIEAALDAAK